MTKTEYETIKKNEVAIRITYESPYSKGTLEIDKIVYLKKLKKFHSLFKDCTILTFEEVKKPPICIDDSGYYRREGRYL